MTETQIRILAEIVRRLLREGYVLSVNTNRKWVVFRSSDQDEIMGSLGISMSETIHAHESIGHYMGVIELNYGPDVPDFITSFTGPFHHIITESERVTSTSSTGEATP